MSEMDEVGENLCAKGYCGSLFSGSSFVQCCFAGKDRMAAYCRPKYFGLSYFKGSLLQGGRFFLMFGWATIRAICGLVLWLHNLLFERGVQCKISSNVYVWRDLVEL